MSETTFPSLHPDLRPYLDGHKLRHPQLKFDFAFPVFFARLNRLYRHQLESHTAQYMPNKWDHFHPELSGPDRLEHFLKTHRPIDDSAYYQLVGQLWTAPELLAVPSGFILTIVDWSHANTSHIMTTAEHAGLAELSETFSLYRGHPESLRDGCSWTLDRNIARQWALGQPAGDSVSTGTVAKKDILAYITRRDEQEILVAPQDVCEIRTERAG
jgi:hypothetical protein